MSAPLELVEDLRLLEPPNPWIVYYWAGGLVGALLLFLLIRAIVKRLRRPHVGVPLAEIRAAQRDALSALEGLFHLIVEGQGKTYAIESSAIIRQYIERRFGIRAPTHSTDEFLHEAQDAPELSPEFRELLSQFLRCCDLLKFARGIATRSELEELHTAAVQFVKETIPRRMEVQA
jgi:hypothetical protein